MGLIPFLPPLEVTESRARSQTWTWLSDGVAQDFTGWTGTWAIGHPVDGILAEGVPTLDSAGNITVATTAAQADVLADYAIPRGRMLPGVQLEIVLTDETTTIVLQSAVMLWRSVDGYR